MLPQIYRFVSVAFILLALFFQSSDASAAETVASCQEMLFSGRYEDCLKATTDAVANKSYGEWVI